MEAWSKEMLLFVMRRSRRYPRMFGLELEDYYHEGLAAAADYLSRCGGGPVDLRRMNAAVKRPMEQLYRGRAMKTTAEGLVRRKRIPIDPGRVFAAKADCDRDAILDVRFALDRMPAKHRDAIWAAYRDYRSTAEMSAACGVSDSTIIARLRDAYAELRRLTEQGYGAMENRIRDRDKADASRRRPVSPRLCFSGRKQINNKVDWSDWGPIPDQRKDDDDA
jgi:hypothetical protein